MWFLKCLVSSIIFLSGIGQKNCMCDARGLKVCMRISNLLTFCLQIQNGEERTIRYAFIKKIFQKNHQFFPNKICLVM